MSKVEEKAMDMKYEITNMIGKKVCIRSPQ